MCSGSKCPTGEHLYSIETKDNGGIKKLFNDLSNHRPIFSDDRLGRRMTFERTFHRKSPHAALSPSRVGKNRYNTHSGVAYGVTTIDLFHEKLPPT